MQQYIKGKSLGQGTWGVVFEATRKKDNIIVAVKRIKNLTEGSNDGVSFSALREVKYLRELNHSNIISVSFFSYFFYLSFFLFLFLSLF